MCELVRRGDTAIDVGANWGFHTIGLSRLVGPDGHVIAIEPGPELVTLRAVCARRANVEVQPLALSDRNGTGHLFIPEVSDTSASALGHIDERDTPAERSVAVRLARLDDLRIPRPARLSFIKCDVEGHEDAVLQGGQKLIRDRMPALLVEIEERHRARPISDAFELLSSWGYIGFALTATGLREVEQFDVDRDQRAHLIDGQLPSPTPVGYVNDFLFVRRGARRPSSTA